MRGGRQGGAGRSAGWSTAAARCRRARQSVSACPSAYFVLSFEQMKRNALRATSRTERGASRRVSRRHMDVNLLIESVKKHVYLYDLSNSDYSNIALKSLTWKSIAEQMAETSEAVKHRWKTIKDAYMKYKKQLLKASESSTKLTEYRWNSQLKFLDAHHATRTPDTTPRKPLNKPQRSSLNEILKRYLQGTPPSSRTNMLLLEPYCQGVNPETTVKQFHADFNPQSPKDNNSDEESANEMEMLYHDAIDNLFLSYAQTFKIFPFSQQAVLKMQLAKMFSKARQENSDFILDNPFSLVQLQSVMSIKGVDIVASPTHWSPSSSCSNSEQTISQEYNFEELIVP